MQVRYDTRDFYVHGRTKDCDIHVHIRAHKVVLHISRFNNDRIYQFRKADSGVTQATYDTVRIHYGHRIAGVHVHAKYMSYITSQGQYHCTASSSISPRVCSVCAFRPHQPSQSCSTEQSSTTADRYNLICTCTIIPPFGSPSSVSATEATPASRQSACVPLRFKLSTPLPPNDAMMGSSGLRARNLY
jgi:hypothetical protein